MARIHHSAICTTDIEASLRFWREGLGLEVQMDLTFTGDWPTLFGAPSDRLRSIFLGDPAHPDDGIVELVDFGPVPDGSPGSASGPTTGFFLLSLNIEIEPVLHRLADLGLGGAPRRIDVGDGVRMAVVRDPNGVQVELIDSGHAGT